LKKTELHNKKPPDHGSVVIDCIRLIVVVEGIADFMKKSWTKTTLSRTLDIMTQFLDCSTPVETTRVMRNNW